MSDWKKYSTGRNPREDECRPTSKGWYHTYLNGTEHSEERYFDGIMMNDSFHGQPDWWREVEIPTHEDNHGFQQGPLPDETGWYLGYDEDLSCPHVFYKDELFCYWRCHAIINGKVSFDPHTPHWWKKDELPEMPEPFENNQ